MPTTLAEYCVSTKPKPPESHVDMADFYDDDYMEDDEDEEEDPIYDDDEDSGNEESWYHDASTLLWWRHDPHVVPILDNSELEMHMLHILPREMEPRDVLFAFTRILNQQSWAKKLLLSVFGFCLLALGCSVTAATKDWKWLLVPVCKNRFQVWALCFSWLFSCSQQHSPNTMFQLTSSYYKLRLLLFKKGDSQKWNGDWTTLVDDSWESEMNDRFDVSVLH